MNKPGMSPDDMLANASREEIMAALFANMVSQQANMALMFLGKVPHPQTGQMVQDLEAAKMFIDQLEMLEAKTKGNLGKEEEALIKQALAVVHMSFVEAAGGSDKSSTIEAGQPATSAEPEPAPETKPPVAPPPAAETPAAPEESRKKFTKKY